MARFQPPRHWTIKEAEAKLPDVRAWLKEARGTAGRLRDAIAHMEDLRIVYERVDEPGHPAHQELQLHERRRLDAKIDLQAIHDRFAEHGILLKDPDMGLVDFYALRGQETVFLCWREDEKHITAWHPIESGFAGRRPLDVTGH